MNLQKIIQQSTVFTAKNAPLILTSVGVGGVLSVAYLTAKASFRASDALNEERDRLGVPKGYVKGAPRMTRKEELKIVAPYYALPAGAVLLTCGAIISANVIGTKRTAAMAAAFTITERAFSEYKDKAVEVVGEKKAQRIQDEVVQDSVTRTPVPGNMVVMQGREQLCFDYWSARYFKGNMEDLKHAQNALNHTILSKSFDNTASLTDFYNLIGLEGTQDSDNLGWNSDKLLELEFTSCLSPDNEPAIAIRFRVEPKRDYFR